MKSILITVPDPLKAKLDAKRAEGYSLNGFVRGVLERELSPSVDRDLDVKHLSKHQIERIEEAMNTDDLEEMVAVVDAIVGRLRNKSSQRRNSS